jgi:hypothetical protein
MIIEISWSPCDVVPDGCGQEGRSVAEDERAVTCAGVTVGRGLLGGVVTTVTV